MFSKQSSLVQSLGLWIICSFSHATDCWVNGTELAALPLKIVAGASIKPLKTNPARRHSSDQVCVKGRGLPTREIPDDLRHRPTCLYIMVSEN